MALNPLYSLTFLMLFECHSFAIRLSFVSQSYAMVWHSYVLVCHPFFTRILSLVCARMSSICHSYELVCHPYVIRMSLVCTCMSSVCHSYGLVCHPYVTPMWFYHEPSFKTI